MDTDIIPLLPVGDEWYISYLHPDIWESVAGPMFRSRGFKIKPQFLEIIRTYFMESRNPNVFDICADKRIDWIAPTNKRSRDDLRSFLHKTGFTDKKTKLFKDVFIESYLVDASKRWNEIEDKISIEEDDQYEDAGTYQVSRSMTVKNFADFLKRDPDILFKIPSYTASRRWIDFTNPNLQFVEFSNFTAPVQRFIRFRYDYTCRSVNCKPVVYYSEVENLRCPTCGGMMKCYHDDKSYHHFYMTSVLYEDQPLTLLSLEKLPIGEITCAVIFQQIVGSASYYGYVLGVKETKYTPEDAMFDTHQHAAFSLAHYICDRHVTTCGTTVNGMDYPKVGAIMSGFANDYGKKSFNYLIVGDAGTGKTKTACMFTHSMSKNSRVQDTTGTTSSGMVGSSQEIKLGGTTTKLHQPGMLAIYKYLVLDEIYSNKKVYADIKHCAGSEYVNKFNAIATFETKKTATIFGTANIDLLHLDHIRRLEGEITRKAMSEDDFCDYSKNFRDLWNLYKDDKTRLVEEACIEYEKTRGVCWIDGVESSVLDRFPLIFYLRENKNDEAEDEFNNSNDDLPYDTFEINEKIYSPAVQELMEERAKIRPTVPDDILPLLGVIFKQLKVHDRVHSKRRLKDNIKLLVKMSAALNGRDVVNSLDVLFVKYLLLHTCRRLEQSEMVMDSIWEGYLEHEQILELIHAPYTGIMYTYCNESVAHKFDTAPKYVQDAEAKQANEKIVTDQSVSTISYGYTTDYTKVFQDAPTDVTKSIMVDYLMDLFMSVKTIKQSALDVFAESYGEDKSTVMGSINYLKDDLNFIEHKNGYLKLK